MSLSSRVIKNDLEVSFIIPNWNNSRLLYECVFSIYETSGDVSYEVIVVDNGSTDGSAELIRGSFPSVQWIQNRQNLGYAKAVNQGVEASRGHFIFLLNNDVKLVEGTTKTLLTFIAGKPDAGAAAPLLYYPDGRLQLSCRRFPKPSALMLECFGIDKVGPFHRWKWGAEEHLTEDIVPQPMASALMIKRDCWNMVGDLDESFPIYFNDVDWCYRLYKYTDYKIYLCHEAKAIHHEGASVKLLGYKKRKFALYKGFLRFYVKHFLSL